MADAIGPFRIDVPDEARVDLRYRAHVTRWPARETVADEWQGVPPSTIRERGSYSGQPSVDAAAICRDWHLISVKQLTGK